jgi:hypothetical protein
LTQQSEGYQPLEPLFKAGELRPDTTSWPQRATPGNLWEAYNAARPPWQRAIICENAIDQLLADAEAVERMADYLRNHPKVIVFADKAEVVRGMLETAKVHEPG